MSTPIMSQYKKIKEEYKNCLLFFRLGDFYELFYEDAKIASKELNITLTKRGHKNENIPMAGVPYHTSEYYISKLVKMGHKVAICEQIGTELNKDKIIPREVVQIITSGTIVNETMLENKRNNFLITIEGIGPIISIGVFDISTNEFFVEEIKKVEIKNYLEKLDPSEILINQTWAIQLKEYGVKINKITIIQEIMIYHAENIILDFFNLHSKDSIKYLTEENKVAVAIILEYIKHTQKRNKINIKLPQKIEEKEDVELDVFTRRNLEITKTLQNTSKGSLLSFIDNTQTPQGGRKIYKYITNPIKNIKKLNKRYENIEFFQKNQKIQKETIETLKEMPDFERILSKIILRKATPNQLYKLSIGAKKLYQLCFNMNKQINKHDEVFNEILEALDENAPNEISPENPYIKENYSKELDEWKTFNKNIHSEIIRLQEQYQKITKINNLRIKKTTLGFLIEINNINKEKLNYSFELRQNLKTTSRFSTQELDVFDEKISKSFEFIKEKEKTIFITLCEKIETIAQDIYEYSKISATLDVYSNLSSLATQFNHTKPILTEGDDFEIKNGKHPILEKVLKEKGEIFVANDCKLNPHVMFITGPNMAGKSTYLRQQAIICLLAHCGMFVPCEYAKIGCVDQIFSRISTNDDIMQGNSTFMVEMIEIALTINRSTKKSFLILDEVGRGTSVEEGVALAQSILEYLLNTLNARTIFSTHYLSLGKIEHKNLQKKMMQIIPNPLTFTYKIIEGVASKSYALEVAKIAGIPAQIIDRAHELL